MNGIDVELTAADLELLLDALERVGYRGPAVDGLKANLNKASADLALYGIPLAEVAR